MHSQLQHKIEEALREARETLAEVAQHVSAEVKTRAEDARDRAQRALEELRQSKDEDDSSSNR